MSYVTKFEMALKWEAVTKIKESLEEKREGMIATNEEKSEMLIKEIVIMKRR
jgi:hypothetical protein